LYDKTSLIVNCQLIIFDNDSHEYKNKELLDIECTTYNVINKILMNIICKKLNIELILLANSRPLTAYNKQLAFNFITHVIYSTLIVNEHVEQIYSMLIVSLRNYRIIVDKL